MKRNYVYLLPYSKFVDLTCAQRVHEFEGPLNRISAKRMAEARYGKGGRLLRDVFFTSQEASEEKYEVHVFQEGGLKSGK